ncbi:hypothetical protein ADILRU_2245 [Leifsonia rubra CMS 76R]|nr:hypothetical protein ADILRU_2245 [Leifsonia rubra CMS 76R]
MAATRGRTRMTGSVASASLLMLMLSACGGGSGGTATPTVTSPASATPSSTLPTATPLPTGEPLVIPGCDDLLPLATAQSIFSPSTIKIDEIDSAVSRTYEVAELDTVATNATIAKNCAWGIPNSDGFFTLTVADISEANAANLKAALLAFGYLGVTNAGVTALELATENEVGSKGRTHYLVGDLWIYVDGTSLDLSTTVAERALEKIRTANPTRTY